MSLVSRELDYKSVDFSHGSYQLSKITPQSESNIISANGGEEAIFEIPGSKVVNFGRSILSFELTPGKGGTSIKNWIHSDGFPFIRQLQLYNREGLFLCDIQNCNVYMKMVSRQSNKISDVQTYDVPANGSGYYTGIYCNNTTVSGTGSSARPSSVNNTPFTNYLEPGYCIGGGTDDTADPVINVQIPLSRFVDSVLSLDKDQYFSEAVYVRIVWNAGTGIGWTNASATDPDAATLAAIATNMSITNLTLYTAIEQNPVIVQALVEKFRSGNLSYNIPFVHMNTVSGLSASGTNNVSVRYSRPHGSRLKKILWSGFHGANNELYNNNNLAAIKFDDYYTMINNVRTTQYNMVQGKGDEWLTQKERLRNSCILSSNEFYYNFVHVDDFSGELSTEHNENIESGLLLDQKVKWDVQLTAKVALKHYVFGITSRTLTLGPSGTTLI